MQSFGSFLADWGAGFTSVLTGLVEDDTVQKLMDGLIIIRVARQTPDPSNVSKGSVI
jgi:hypothetical protein